MRRPLPTSDEVRHAMDSVLREAASVGRRATVAAVERQLGITHPTFYRHYSDLINEYFQPRATRSPLPVEPTSRNVEHDTTERRLRREIADLRKTVSLYGEAIRQLALENHALRTQLDQAGNITSLRPITASPFSTTELAERLRPQKRRRLLITGASPRRVASRKCPSCPGEKDLGGFTLESIEPGAGHCVEPIAVESVDPFSSSQFDSHQSGVLKNTQVTAGGGPTAVETRGDLA
jgi:AcrR family transcriptional regulator